MRLGVRAKLVLLSLLILVVVSFSFTWLQIRLSRAWFEEDLRTRAVIFAREVAATIGDRREFENRELLQHKIRQIMAVRQSVFQLDVLGFDETGSHIVEAEDVELEDALPHGHDLPDLVLEQLAVLELAAIADRRSHLAGEDDGARSQ